jgi:hypothetical protein
MATPEFTSFEEFWPFYVREHANATNRKLHFVGATLAVATAAAALVSGRRRLLLAAPVLGYGFAWLGHLVFEGNTPATFEYPAWSLRGDFVMWWKMATGAMDEELARAKSSNGVSEGTHAEPAPAAVAPEAVN